jgi:hypothetical protein
MEGESLRVRSASRVVRSGEDRRCSWSVVGDRFWKGYAREDFGELSRAAELLCSASPGRAVGRGWRLGWAMRRGVKTVRVAEPEFDVCFQGYHKWWYKSKS